MNSTKLFIIIIFFISCHNAAEEEEIIGNYYLIAVDMIEDLGLGYKVDRSFYKNIIEPTVFSIGYNEEYIIVKQHPRTWPAKPNKLVTNYFIVPIYREYTLYPKEGVLGPLSELEFVNKMDDLALTDKIIFTKTYEYLE